MYICIRSGQIGTQCTAKTKLVALIFIGHMNALCQYLRQCAVLGDNLYIHKFIYHIYVNLGNTNIDKTARKQRNIILAIII